MITSGLVAVIRKLCICNSELARKMNSIRSFYSLLCDAVERCSTAMQEDSSCHTGSHSSEETQVSCGHCGPCEITCYMFTLKISRDVAVRVYFVGFMCYCLFVVIQNVK